MKGLSGQHTWCKRACVSVCAQALAPYPHTPSHAPDHAHTSMCMHIKLMCSSKSQQVYPEVRRGGYIALSVQECEHEHMSVVERSPHAQAQPQPSKFTSIYLSMTSPEILPPYPLGSGSRIQGVEISTHPATFSVKTNPPPPGFVVGP